MQPKTLYDKIWDSHVVVPGKSSPSIIYIDLHLVHEVTSPQAFAELRKRGLRVRRPDLTLGTADHSIPTTTRVLVASDDQLAYDQVKKLDANCDEFGIELFGITSDKQGIVHVIGPESGATQPGKTIAQGYRTPDIRNYDKETKRSCRLVSTREMGEIICNFIESPDAA